MVSDENFRRLQELKLTKGFKNNGELIVSLLDGVLKSDGKVTDIEEQKATMIEEMADLKGKLAELWIGLRKEGMDETFRKYSDLFKAIEKANPGLSGSEREFLFIEQSSFSPEVSRYLNYRRLALKFLSLRERFRALSPSIPKPTTATSAPEAPQDSTRDEQDKAEIKS